MLDRTAKLKTYQTYIDGKWTNAVQNPRALAPLAADGNSVMISRVAQQSGEV